MFMIERDPDSGHEQTPNWQVEEFYFGLGEWSIYRRSGERIQYKVEKGMPLTIKPGTHQYHASPAEVADFLGEYEDCEFVVADSYELTSGGRETPSLWVSGWKDLADHQRHIYENNKANDVKPPGQP